MGAPGGGEGLGVNGGGEYTRMPSPTYPLTSSFSYWSACVLLESMAGEMVPHTAMHCVGKVLCMV